MRPGYRTRLAAWHAIVLAVTLGASVVVLDWTVRRIILDQFDAALLHAAQSVGAEIDEEGPKSPVEALATKPVRRLLWTFRPIVQVVDGRGDIVTLLGSQVPLRLDPPQLTKVIGRGKIAFQTLTTADSRVLRVAALRASHGGQTYAVEVAHPLDEVQVILQRIRWLLASVAVAVLIAIVAMDLVLTRQVLRPIDAIVRKARRLNDASLAEPLPHPGEPGELARLVETLNAMLGRIRDSVEGQRRFTADAAHELRSPLTRLRTELEVTLRRPRDAAEYRATLATTLEEIERLGAVAESLLILARLDAGEGRTAAEAQRLSTIVEAIVGRFEPMAASRGIALRIAPQATDALVEIAPGIVDVVVGNVLDNAVKFSPPGGTIDVNITGTPSEVCVTVTDMGPGIPEDERPRVFERFFRGKSPRAMGTSGVGLGLAIAQMLVQRQHGAIDIDSKAGSGTTVTIRFPVASMGAGA
ncbi:MAG TPA: ATP-binding protein [Methylomirabilota bacterium]|jgi:two-component system OmpR family sensor kinase